MVVIREVGHPVPRLEFLLEDSGKDMEKRRAQVARAMTIENVTIPAVLDTPDGAVETAYKAWPSSAVVVTTTGQIAVRLGGKGTVDSIDADQLERWLREHLGRPG
jgi:hypothetical protein